MPDDVDTLESLTTTWPIEREQQQAVLEALDDMLPIAP